MFIVDSLKQLSSKYLGGNIGKSGYQSEIFRPFKEIFSKSDRPAIQDYALLCVNNLLMKARGNVKTGWPVVFEVIQ